MSSKPHTLDLGDRGVIEGLALCSGETQKALCYYFGGVPYALPPTGTHRWRQARPLPREYSYGSRQKPGKFSAKAPLCPQIPFQAPVQPELWDEDCLRANIYVPIEGEKPEEKKPADGWPVLFWIHGGWLQCGSASSIDPTALLAETPVKAVVVAPNYRLNLFGFLSSQELVNEAVDEPACNFGFWDQRRALEWTHQTVRHFGGNPHNITVAGYSAGGNSTFYQLAYDTLRPDASQRLIRRGCIFSNGLQPEPQPIANVQRAFDELVARHGIDTNSSSAEKLSRLRALTPRQLVATNQVMTHHIFRPVQDGVFVPHDLQDRVDSGELGALFRAQGKAILIGECADENYVYSLYRPPTKDSPEALRDRILTEYAPNTVDALFAAHVPDGTSLPDRRVMDKPCANWESDAFGLLYADLQVWSMQRGLINALARGNDKAAIYRYRIEYRAECVDAMFPPSAGVTHTTDMPLWFWGNGVASGLTADEKRAFAPWIHTLARFLARGDAREDANGSSSGDAAVWPTSSIYQQRVLRPDMSTEIVDDAYWSRGLALWKRVRDARAARTRARARL